MSRVYVGNLDPRVSERDLEDEFRVFGVIRSVWVARRPPGYAFIDFDDHRDAEDAIRELDGAQAMGAEVTVLVDDPLGVAVPLLVGVATAEMVQGNADGAGVKCCKDVTLM
ncbi:Rbp1 [Gossypium arboreum]|uniref:Rbp1 n=1 Tax=Gossypium arboreum TaxID=29729 RepID=A0A0B0Q1N4_GOSAR|nr:Rbp1 [Gossypium arboreum]